MLLLISLLAIPLLAVAIGSALGYAAIHLRVERDPLIDQINALLPNGQCGQCGFPGCAQAAQGMVDGKAGPACCPPGGPALAEKLAALLGVSPGAGDSRGPLVAAIDDSACDGCGRCFKKCPFDAIVGAPRLLHGVIADACTGCGLCTNVCPHGGISLYPDLQFAAPLVKPQLGGSRHA